MQSNRQISSSRHASRTRRLKGADNTEAGVAWLADEGRDVITGEVGRLLDDPKPYAQSSGGSSHMAMGGLRIHRGALDGSSRCPKGNLRVR